MAKKYIAFIMAIVIIATIFTACQTKNKKDENPAQIATETTTAEFQTDDKTFSLSYTKSDSLDPFDAVTQNNQIIAELVFESLFDLDDDFKPSLNIASSYEYTGDKTLKITIPSGLQFSDGSSLTTDDIASSFRRAKKSDFWADGLNGISSCYADSSTEIVFSLKYTNKNAHALLTFPIESTDDKDGYPIGSGRYSFDEEDGEPILKANVTDSFKPHITTIHLENIAAADSIDNAINIGNITFAFRDLGADSAKKISSNKRLVNMNNLVYIGVNNKSGITSNPYIRKAISLAVDRSTLIKSAYSGYAQVANSLFNPQSSLVQSTALFEETADQTAAKQAIAKSGSGSLSLSLLVNESNKDRVTCATLVKQELEAVGFSVNIIKANDGDYQDKVKKESFDIYIGETKIPVDMNLYSFFAEDGNTHFGIDTKESATANSYDEYLSGNAELGTFLLQFSDEMPYIPLLYRKGELCFAKAMNGDMHGTYFDSFANIEDWYFNAE